MELASPILLVSSVNTANYLTLLTFPGVDDINLFRVAAANFVRRKAAFEMLVGRSERVLTDNHLYNLIKQSIKAHGAKRTGLLISQMDVSLHLHP